MAPVYEFTEFRSPSSNVVCYIEVDYLRCDIAEANWSPPPRPGGLVRLRAGLALFPAAAPNLCAPATQLLRPTAALSPTASRSPRGRCDATVRSRGSHAGIPRPARASRFPARRISCSERVRGDGSAVVVEICAATLWWTIVVLRDGRRCRSWRADVAQLVAHHLAKVRVAGSNPVIRSKVQWHQPQRWSGRVVRQRPAKPCTRVRFPSPPPMRFPARLAQRESASLTRKRSLVQSQYRAPA